MTRTWLIGGLLLIAGAGAHVFASPDTQTRKPETQLGENQARPVVARGVVDVEGGIIQIAASRDGVIREVHVEEGATVARGDLLAVIDDRLPRAALEVARAELAQAESAKSAVMVRIAAGRRELARVEPLTDFAAPRRTVDQARDNMRLAEADLQVQSATIETARARVAQAELEVEQRSVRAPVDGTIVRRLVRPGDGASTLNVTTLFWLAPAGPRLARIEIEEQTAERVKPGQPVEIVIDGDDGRRFKGTVSRVGQAFGARRVTVYEARERADVRFVEAIVGFNDADPGLLLGQRVLAYVQAH